jgi:hypothetical protein
MPRNRAGMRWFNLFGSLLLTACSGTAEQADPTPSELVQAAPVTQAVDWRALESRELRLPTLLTGADCPAAHGDPLGIGSVVGDGPIVAVMGDVAGQPLSSTGVQQEGRFASKTLWLARDGYTGPALIRGAQLDIRRSLVLRPVKRYTLIAVPSGGHWRDRWWIRFRHPLFPF